MRQLILITAFGCAVTGTSAFAQGSDPTLTLMPQGATLPDAVTAAIDLPTDEEGVYIPADAAIEHGAQGLETANAAREDGRAFGEATAAAAQENREDVARGSRPDLEELLPDQVPTVPELPGLPELPDRPDRPTPPTP